MDQNHQVLSHQVETVNRLASKFDCVVVLTGRIGYFKVESNVQVRCFHWEQGKRVKSIIRFLKLFFKTILKEKFSVVFSHMTSVHSAFVSPITKIVGLKHYLWYAHTSNGIFLKISKIFIDGIITSTPGSCPISGKKVFPIGQAIDSKKFVRHVKDFTSIRNLIHIGRFDPSKNVETIIKVVEMLRFNQNGLNLAIIGSPSTTPHRIKTQDIIKKYSSNPNYQWLKFTSHISRNLIPKALEHADCFIHAFQGSLDKTLVEATFSGLPVITVNNEYRNLFGSWSKESSSSLATLEVEARSFFEASASEIEAEINRRYLIAIENHEISGWIDRLVAILRT